MTGIYREDIERILADPGILWDKLAGCGILVTGATGLLGELIVKTLVALREKEDMDFRIYALARNREKIEHVYSDYCIAYCDDDKEEPVFGQEKPYIHFICSDIRDFTDFVGQIDYIIHAASETSSRAFIEQPVEVEETAIIGTRNLLHIDREKHVKCMLFLSTMEVYGTPQTDEKISEDRVLEAKPGEVRGSYPIGKIACESLCTGYAGEYGVPVSVLRLTQTFGAGVVYDDGRVFAEFARCVIEGRDIRLKTKGETRRNYLYTTDAIRCMLMVLLSDRVNPGEVYNVANEDTYCSIAEMAELVAECFGENKIRVVFDIDSDAEKMGYAPTLCMNLDTSKIRALGWHPEVSMEEMYRRMIEYMRSCNG
ncbi:MAG: NAD(P)-dependent oxidoreductase [Eubacterium sp.]|nr:NAD(P)-dependent oxidoreductase [Eubacterium sp.]